jgi:hypothetical protein
VNYQYTPHDLEQARAGFARHREGLRNGERDPVAILAKPACSEACSPCYGSCSVFMSIIGDIEHSLASQNAIWHDGHAYVAEGGAQ